MKSEINYITDEKDSKLYKELLDLIKDKIKEHSNRVINPSYYLCLLLLSKYIIEKNNLDLTKILNGNTDKLEKKLYEETKKFEVQRADILISSFIEYKIYELLKKIIYEKYEIPTYDDRVLSSYIEQDKKYLVICVSLVNHIKYPNVDIYTKDIYGSKMLLNQAIDTIVGIKRKYYKDVDDIKWSSYDKVIFINNGRTFKDIRELVDNNYHRFNSLLMACNYSSISKYRARLINIKSILIDKDKAYIEYIKSIRLLTNKDDYKISIKELTNVEDDDLKDIINSDQEINGKVIHTTLEDIRNNSFRIGFKAYNRKFNPDRTKVLRLIDYNEYLTSEIRKLDNEISKQIDSIIVR